MRKITEEIVEFFQSQGFVIVSTIDKDSSPHNSCKGIVRINKNGSIYLLDLYQGRTYENLRESPQISITAVDEHKFRGYCLKGKAKIMGPDKLKSQIIKAWEDKIAGRITQRVLKNMRGEKGHHRHPEVLLPKPEYMIVMKTEEVVDLTPHHLR